MTSEETDGFYAVESIAGEDAPCLEHYSELFEEFSSAHRVRILVYLEETEIESASEIADTIGLSESNLSYHIGRLVDEGLVENESRSSHDEAGNYSYYRLTSRGERQLDNLVEFIVRDQVDEAELELDADEDDLTLEEAAKGFGTGRQEESPSAEKLKGALTTVQENALTARERIAAVSSKIPQKRIAQKFHRFGSDDAPRESHLESGSAKVVHTKFDENREKVARAAVEDEMNNVFQSTENGTVVDEKQPTQSVEKR
ncbi:ArsR/SmtB family transcription factor [Halorubrum saccharovorum]|uniref:ArsR/SmtB family transcription factor n=1 Tax=Halorubrum saccharovorum TaxID=2248 RepID=UPI0009B5C790|nr:winged helix-turn-helix domain-containing protein [Halorubrum saccharovorum]